MTDSSWLDRGVPPRSESRRRAHLLIELVVAATIASLTVYASLPVKFGTSSGAVLVVWLVALAVSLPLVFRKRWPIPVFGVVLASAIIGVLLGMSAAATVLALAVGVALYTTSLVARPKGSVVALGAALLGITLTTVLTTAVLPPHYFFVQPALDFNPDLPSMVVFFCFTIVGAWALGRNFRARREYAIQLAEHRAQQAVAEERLRIAREMHDVVAHSMSVIVMKAAVANHVYDTRPEESREALRIVEAVGRDALADIQRVLGSLRSEGEADLAPSPTLDELPKLIENARLANVEVELDGDPIPALPSAVQLSAYRIVQEALTNVIKHVTAPARCTVRVTAESGELHLVVVNYGKPRCAAGQPGHGLIGMRERAALHHGSLVAGWQPGGGFAVHARLPYQVGGPHA
jgi:signal transduction histidine kinase